MSPDETELRNLTRRHFFAESSLGIGSVALASLLSGNPLLAAPNTRQTNPLAPALPHFAAKAKRVIFLFMAGGPSQLELFDSKPKLQALDGQVIPASYVKNKRFAFIKQRRQTPGHATQVSPLRPKRPGNVDALAAPGFGHR